MTQDLPRHDRGVWVLSSVQWAATEGFKQGATQSKFSKAPSGHLWEERTERRGQEEKRGAGFPGGWNSPGASGSGSGQDAEGRQELQLRETGTLGPKSKLP